ncbi:hypothetical protein KVD47_06780 [Helicobacter pylori]|uniref:hypothetical protein n=1 Tax=Helicobacter pylori TaxID=210 RepID=UPI000C30F9AF|nr:hypothetical protein [Helicobacter pylori]WRE48726.1 hypothetical protein KVD47_06780 [Helicobacter pylori]
MRERVFKRKVLDANILKEMHVNNVCYSKHSKDRFIPFRFDKFGYVECKLFKKILNFPSNTTFFGGTGCKKLMELLSEIVIDSRSSKIALNRHYALTRLQWCDRTLRHNLKILEEKGFLTAFKNKKGYVFLFMRDFTKIEGYEHLGLNGESNLPNNFFLGICGYLKKLFKKLKDRVFKLSNKHGVFFLKIPKHFQMQNFNNIFLEFVSVNNPCLSYRLTYNQLVGKKIPNIKCSYQQAIVKKNIHRALDELSIDEKILAS